MSGGDDGDTYWDAGARDAPGVATAPAPPPTAVPPGSPGPWPAGRPSDRGSLRSRSVVVATGVAALVGAAAAAVVVTALHHGTTARTRPPVSRARAPVPTSPSSAELTAARSLDNLLVQNEQNRTSVQGATEQILSCGDVGAAVGQLRQRASFRAGLLRELADLDVSALPGSAALVADLRSAWQASITSDDAYAQWGADETPACTPNDVADAHFRAAQASDAAATAAKRAFVARWDAAAPVYGLPQWQATQL